METIKTSAMGPATKVNIPVTTEIKRLLLDNQGKIGAAAGLIAGTIFVSGRYFSSILEKEPAPVSEVDCVDDVQVECTDGTYITAETGNIIAIADSQNDFESEFEKQRQAQGPGGIFEYNGKMYNTYFKEEWDSMSQADRNAYYAKVGMSLDEDKLHLVVSDGDGHTAILAYNDQNIMGIQLIDEDKDGIVDVVKGDLNMDGTYDTSYQIEKVVVTPEATVVEDSDHRIIDDSEVNPAHQHDIETVDPDDQTIIKPEIDHGIEGQNIINNENIGQYNLPGMIDDMNMDEFL